MLMCVFFPCYRCDSFSDVFSFFLAHTQRGVQGGLHGCLLQAHSYVDFFFCLSHFLAKEDS